MIVYMTLDWNELHNYIHTSKLGVLHLGYQHTDRCLVAQDLLRKDRKDRHRSKEGGI